MELSKLLLLLLLVVVVVVWDDFQFSIFLDRYIFVEDHLYRIMDVMNCANFDTFVTHTFCKK